MNAPAGTVVASTKALECPSCGGPFELHAAGYSTLHMCQYCGSEIDLTNDDTRLVAAHVEAAKTLQIPLGTKGTINGVEWVCVGNIEKNDGWDTWEEFLLFNPYHGYRWLIWQASGWSVGTPILSQLASPRQDTFEYEGARMKRIYDPAESTVERAIGEFYWQVKKGDKVKSTSYVGGGKVLSCEITGDENNWTLEEFVESKAVAKAFGIEDTGQYPASGDYPQPHHPNPYGNGVMTSALIASIAFAAALLISVLLSFGGEERHMAFTANPATSARSFDVGTFTMTGRPKPVTITARGEPGDNNWMYLEYTLTNTATDEEIIASQPIEYYYGRDWKEDDRRGTVKIASVPPGTYQLTAEVLLPEDEARGPVATAKLDQVWVGSGAQPGRAVSVVVTSNGTFNSHFFLLFLALFGPVIWVGMRAASFETARQSGYDGADDDDDD
ncbi:MAG: DUF4178 domain-containing protein [Pseudomonadota bacterium]